MAPRTNIEESSNWKKKKKEKRKKSDFNLCSLFEVLKFYVKGHNNASKLAEQPQLRAFYVSFLNAIFTALEI